MKLLLVHSIVLYLFLCEFHGISGSFASGRLRFVNKLEDGIRKILESEKTKQDVETSANETRERKQHSACKGCNEGFGMVILGRRLGTSEDILRMVIYKMCMQLTSDSKESCEGYIKHHFETLMYMIDNRKDLDGQRICSILLQHFGCTDYNRKNWDVAISPKTSNIPKINLPLEDKTISKVLHLTDFHYDPLYEPGSNADCKLPLCCQKSSGVPSDPKNAAGFWGDYHVCDVPWHSIIDVLGHIKKQHTNIEYIYYTGDIISHRCWDTSIVDNTAAIKRVYGQLFETFGATPVYPVLGNHEPHPNDFWGSTNASYPTHLSSHWLFDLVSKEWSRWLPNDALETIKKGGYYTVLAKPNFRIVALNSNVCYTANVWLFFEDKDPYGQLQWLADTLKRSEDAGEVVHILSHVPVGDVQCLENWNEVFIKIVERFSHVIKAHFNGHTHLDEFRVFYDERKTEVINVAFNGGSFTPFVGYNLNYKIFDVGNKFEVLDYEQWTYNMSEANLTPGKPPKWFKQYSFRNAYNISSMSLEKLGKLVQQFSTNNKLLEKYFRFEVREGEAAIAKGCNSTCLNGKLCAIKSVHTADAILCNDF